MRMTTLCYLERDGSYLMLHRVKKQHDDSHNKWIGVGGKFEADESPEDCMLREVREETGLRVTRWRYHGLVTFVSDVAQSDYMHLFSATEWEGELHACDEGELQWVSKKSLGQLTLWEGDRIFLALMQQDRPFFSLKLTYRGDTLVQAVLDGKEIALNQYLV
ncbi:MAG: 8-oxo-dGTP diphosphatase [Bacteroidales bacterium]|nr:8-oxo-dGTP diphosphatase [Bacteroidales bacterium]